MSSTFTPNRIYELQATGENSGTWGTLLNAVLSIIDLNLGGRLAVNVAGNTDITLSTTQERNIYHKLTGALTGNINYIFTAANGGFYIINNASTGAFTITAKPSGGSGFTLPQGSTTLVFINPDATDAESLTFPNVLTTLGDMIYRDASGAQRLPIGSATKSLLSIASGIPAWTKIVPRIVVTLTDGASVALDASLGSNFELTTTTNPTIAAPTNPTDGQVISIDITASGGSRTATLNTSAGGFHFGSTITAITATVSGKKDTIVARYDLANTRWDVVGYLKGF